MVVSATPHTTQLPGLGLPLNWILDQDGIDLFPNAANQRHVELGLTRLPLTSLRELAMLRILDRWTDKLDWHLKIFDEAVIAEWKAEALKIEWMTVSEFIVDCCINELRYKAKVFEKTGAISLHRGEVVKSDSAVPVSLREELKIAVLLLEKIPTWCQDWKSDSNRQILSLIDPSLFPLVYGQTRAITGGPTTLQTFVGRCGEGAIVPVPPDSEAVMGNDRDDTCSYSFSRKFQWLPCNVDVSEGYRSTKITSYINNLHPTKHANIYRVIEKIIGWTIPVWNMTLTPLRGNQQAIRVPYHFCTYEELEPGDEVEDEPEQGSDEDDEIFQERHMEWMAETHRVAQPLPDKFKPPGEPRNPVDLGKDYSDQGLQVIVRLENVHLTPEKPTYKCGPHIEGQINEHICATALYYYNCTNMGPSRLSFRQQSNPEDATIVDHPMHHHDWLIEVFGCEFDEAAVQEVGGVCIKEGRLVTWPNILQHQVHMCLNDATQPGHCKILVLYLVDPNIRIISTADIPCQRKDWWAEAVIHQGGPLSRLPVELRDYIFALVEEFPVGLDEAAESRRKMAKERSAFADSIGELFEEDQFYCDH
ncbi:hypothetical protein BDZ94DRAFT_1310197 [Collybia nuda]|uniref:Uncharacterized protein n=1 Tax=Collybia nuda TaxID=64659 RepID=A0A9P5Y365_9AGAR|nr:hypothetical protein BDZ94DRAFT_1310197 [Collybia nuda]